MDRWNWLRRRLPPTANEERLVDIGCGNGGFTIGAALRGYMSTGLTWDGSDQRKAERRSRLCGAYRANFEVLDVRRLGERIDFTEAFDIAVCTENIEHIIDDFRLMRDIAHVLKPGGRLLLTTPNAFYRPISEGDKGPFVQLETGGHVRRGYSPAMVRELCINAGLVCEDVSYCSGILSQKTTAILRRIRKRSRYAGWLITLPIRPLIPLVDSAITGPLSWPYYSICVQAYKPRIAAKNKK